MQKKRDMTPLRVKDEFIQILLLFYFDFLQTLSKKAIILSLL